MRRSRHEGRPPGLAVHADSGGAGEVVELLLPPRPEAVSIARLVVAAVVAGEPAFDEDRAADLRLAVSEACTSAIQAQGHGAEAGADLPVAVRCAPNVLAVLATMARPATASKACPVSNWCSRLPLNSLTAPLLPLPAARSCTR